MRYHTVELPRVEWHVVGRCAVVANRIFRFFGDRNHSRVWINAPNGSDPRCAEVSRKIAGPTTDLKHVRGAFVRTQILNKPFENPWRMILTLSIVELSGNMSIATKISWVRHSISLSLFWTTGAKRRRRRNAALAKPAEDIRPPP